MTITMDKADTSLTQLKASIEKVEKDVPTHTGRGSVPVGDLSECHRLLKELKEGAAVFELEHLSGSQQTKNVKALTSCRSIWECSVLVAALGQDENEFQRSIKRLTTTFYRDLYSVLPASDLQSVVIGLHLLYLLSTNKLGEFHTQVEHITPSLKSTLCVMYSLELEVALMDGNFIKVVDAASQVPRPVFSCFMGQLVTTARLKVARCLEAAYTFVDSHHAAKLLMLPVDNQHEALIAFIEEVNQSKIIEGEREGERKWAGGNAGALEGGSPDAVIWELVDGGKRVEFARLDKDRVSQGEKVEVIPSLELIQSVIEYATELERIV
eukprot:GHVN01005205.1.p1 GENE.GHVN01005205.1~~GHVN01005205.1.p1  ORF type:complete len:325 (+),score=99.72 GHVN01005205.1:302-1276(+)